MKKRRNKKRIIIAAVIVYLAVIGIVAVWESGRQKPANPDTAAAQVGRKQVSLLEQLLPRR